MSALAAIKNGLRHYGEALRVVLLLLTLLAIGIPAYILVTCFPLIVAYLGWGIHPLNVAGSIQGWLLIASWIGWWLFVLFPTFLIYDKVAEEGDEE